jgi:putative pyruvate formate lyase activating enzyme
MKVSFDSLKKCNLCPRNCNADRFSGHSGYCRSDYQYNINSIVNHKGEEPLISGKNGICNVFFNHCNLQCVFCQNHQISNNLSINTDNSWCLEQIISIIHKHLENGCKSIGFVSPSHQIPQVISIIRAFDNYHPKPIFVYNTNAYDKAEVLKELEGMIDIYLPDLKYASETLSFEYSDAADYPSISRKALKEMFRQKGAVLHLLDKDHAESGIIIRHLVLPGHVENSISVLRFIAEELSPKIHISLMSQFYPTYKANLYPNINRTLTSEEYDQVITEMENLGMSNGWIQELDSKDNYRPDFIKEHPFEG